MLRHRERSPLFPDPCETLLLILSPPSSIPNIYYVSPLYYYYYYPLVEETETSFRAREREREREEKKEKEKKRKEEEKGKKKERKEKKPLLVSLTRSRGGISWRALKRDTLDNVFFSLPLRCTFSERRCSQGIRKKKRTRRNEPFALFNARKGRK